MKTTVITDYRVVVRVPEPFYIGQGEDKKKKAYLNRLRDLEKDIRRHIDDIESIDIETTSEEICSHCELTWEIDQETNEPSCCQAAIDEWRATSTTLLNSKP